MKTYSLYEIQKQGLLVSKRTKKPLKHHGQIRLRLQKNGHQPQFDPITGVFSYRVTEADLKIINALEPQNGL